MTVSSDLSDGGYIECLTEKRTEFRSENDECTVIGNVFLSANRTAPATVFEEYLLKLYHMSCPNMV